MVLGPCAVVDEGHQVHAQAVGEGATATLAALEAGTTSGRDHTVTLLPSSDAGAELNDGAGGLVTLGDNGTLRRERAADEAQVGMANSTVGNLDEHLTGPWVRDRDVLEGDGPICGVETFGKHGFCHL